MEFMEKKGWRGAGIRGSRAPVRLRDRLRPGADRKPLRQGHGRAGRGAPGRERHALGPQRAAHAGDERERRSPVPRISPRAVYTLDFALQGFGKVQPDERHRRRQREHADRRDDEAGRRAGERRRRRVRARFSTRRRPARSRPSPRSSWQNVPTARDPWVVLATAPGVQIDRVNVGGSESGQQAVYIGKGSGVDPGDLERRRRQHHRHGRHSAPRHRTTTSTPSPR